MTWTQDTIHTPISTLQRREKDYCYCGASIQFTHEIFFL
jgi:hypothetical protein